MLTSQLTTHINAFWEQEILPALHEYIRIPNESPLFDPDWQAHGHMERAVALVTDWIRRQHIPGGTLKCCRTATAHRCCYWTFRVASPIRC